MIKDKHITFDFNTKEMVCGHCGTIVTVTLPVLVSEFVTSTRQFIKKHRDCVQNASQRPMGGVGV